MANFMGLSCPSCRDADGIEIQGSVWVRLMPDGAEPISGVEWIDASPARCRACCWVGAAGAALDDDAEPEPEA